MSERALPLVVACGERVICHLVDPDALAGDLPAIVGLYFAPHTVGEAPLRTRSANGERVLDPALPIGAQVDPDAEILFPTV